MDPKFGSIQDNIDALEGPALNTTSTNEHVTEIERNFRVLKEKMGALTSSLPYLSIPRIMVIETVNSILLWINDFPSNGGVSTTIRPREIVTRTTMDTKRHCRVEFGAY